MNAKDMGSTGSWTGYGHVGWSRARGYTAQASGLQSRCNVPLNMTRRDPYTKADVEGRLKKGIWTPRKVAVKVSRPVAPKQVRVLERATDALGRAQTIQVRAKPLSNADLMRRYPGLSLADIKARIG